MQPKHIIAPDGAWEKWVLDGRLHNENKPAYIRYENGKATVEEWWLSGCIHRENGPACVVYEDGRVIHEEWWVDGKYLNKGDFTSIEMIDRMKAYRLFSPIEIAKMKSKITI